MANEQNQIIMIRGRCTAANLVVKKAFNDRSKARYNIEIAFPANDKQVRELEDALLDFADDKWGDGASGDPDLVIPLLDGDRLARKREANGKDGGYYKGMTVVRSATDFNKDGDDGPGGVAVYDEEINPVPASQITNVVYAGCMVEIAVEPKGYETNKGDNGITLYLQAVQKIDEGERLYTGRDASTLFKPVGRSSQNVDDDGRRRRRVDRSRTRTRDEEDDEPRRRRSRDEDDEPRRRRSRDEDDEPRRRRSRDEDDKWADDEIPF